MKVSKELKIALLQSDLVWENPTINRIKFQEQIKNIKEPVDLIVLPEMFTTGFTMNAKVVAEAMSGKTVLWMQKLAKEKKTAISGSIIICENNQHYNRLLFVHPSGKTEIYNKKHTFTLAGEEKVYTAGNKKLIVEYLGWKICPLICYDLRFPVWARNTKNYDVLLFVASWPATRINAWDTLLKARAIENMSFTIGVNRIGEDANNYLYPGHSSAYDCLGNELCKNINEKSILVITLNKDSQEKVRRKLNFLNDRDVFKIQ